MAEGEGLLTAFNALLVRVEHAGKVIHDFIAIAANDPNEAAAADRRFA
jgi:hypothetical protein